MIVKYSTTELQTIEKDQEPIWLKTAEEAEEKAEKECAKEDVDAAALAAKED